MGRLYNEGDDGEGAAGGAADVRARGVPAGGDGGCGARRAAAGEADGEQAAHVGAQVRSPSIAARALVGKFCARPVQAFMVTHSVVRLACAHTLYIRS